MSDILVSFGVPSYRDITFVTETIDMLFNNASKPERVEVVFRFNNDGHGVSAYGTEQKYIDTILETQPMWRHNNLKFIFGEQNHGYCSMSDFHHDIAEEFSGEFVFWFNDDVTGITEGYDEHLEPFVGKCVILNVNNHHNEMDFFIMSRKWIEFNGGCVGYTSYLNYDYSDYCKWFPEIAHRVEITCDHKPTAAFGKQSGGGHDCRAIVDDNYTLNTKHFGVDGKHRKNRNEEKGLNKWVKMVLVDMRNMKKLLTENPDTIYDIENCGPETWKAKHFNFPKGTICDCCKLEDVEWLQKQIEKSNLLL